jgi:hypothetical protein
MPFIYPQGVELDPGAFDIQIEHGSGTINKLFWKCDNRTEEY